MRSRSTCSLACGQPGLTPSTPQRVREGKGRREGEGGVGLRQAGPLLQGDGAQVLAGFLS